MPAVNSRFLTSLVLAGVLLFAGCSMKKWALNKAAGSLTGEGSTVWTGDNDPQLVADALPFALKMYESLLEAVPENQDLLVGTGKAFCMYAFAFIQSPADTLPDSRIEERTAQYQRAKKMYLRSRSYLFRAFELQHPQWRRLMETDQTDSALALTTAADTTLLYWTAASWMGAFTADKFDMSLAVNMHKPVACMRRVIELNPQYGDGSAHEFFISYYGSIPASMGGSEEKARTYYQQALDLSGGKKAGPHVALATSVCIPKQDIEEFQFLLKKALNVDIDASPENRLANILSQNKARWLLNNMDEFFLITQDDTEEAESETQHDNIQQEE